MILGAARYEFRMAIGRYGVWLAFALATVMVGWGAPALVETQAAKDGVWAAAGRLAFMMNVFMPLVAGISLADRFVRDRDLATAELRASTATPAWQMVLGKYLGGVATVAVQVGAAVAVIAVWTASHGAPLSFILAYVLAFFVVNLPPLAFVSAFSIACPAVMPVRVYQALFTGYWFWGNFLNPKVMPTIAETALVASGLPQAQVCFGAGMGTRTMPTLTFALVNLGVLAMCAAGILAALVWYMQRQEAHA